MAAIRAMTPAERLRRWEEFNAAMEEMETAAFSRRYPGLTERECFLLRMRLRYGAELSAEIWPDVANLVA